MEGIVVCLGRSRNIRFRKLARQSGDAKLAKRYLIIVNLDDGRTVADAARALGVSQTTIRRVRKRFWEYGEAGLGKKRGKNRGHSTPVRPRVAGEDYRFQGLEIQGS